MEEPASFVYTRDDARRRIRVTAQRALQREDFRAIVDRQAQEETWRYAMLYDLRLMPWAVPIDDADMLAAQVYRHLVTYGPRGPVAVVTTSIEVIGAARLYSVTTARAGIDVKVFWDLAPAEQWLDEQQPLQL
jgi:hypothetical protein